MTPNLLTVVAAEDHHLERVSEALREEDLMDLRAINHNDALQGFRYGARFGRCWAVLLPSGLACAVGGVVPDPGGKSGRVWMMATDELTQHRKEFIRRIPAYIDALHEICPILHNVSRVSNQKYRRWLKWAGFTFLPLEADTDTQEEPLQKFIRIKPCLSPQ